MQVAIAVKLLSSFYHLSGYLSSISYVNIDIYLGTITLRSKLIVNISPNDITTFFLSFFPQIHKKLFLPVVRKDFF
jgi:hypothetical protein